MLRLMTFQGAPPDEPQPTDSRHIEAWRWGEPIEANRRVVLRDGRAFLAQRGERHAAVSISRTVSTNENILADVAPILSRGLPPIRIEASKPIPAGAVLFGGDGGRVTDERFGEPIGTATGAARAGDIVTVAPMPASPRQTTADSGGRAAVESVSPSIGVSTMSVRPPHVVSVTESWNARVAGFQSKGMTKAQAIRQAVAQYPAAHQAMLREQNAQPK